MRPKEEIKAVWAPSHTAVALFVGGLVVENGGDKVDGTSCTVLHAPSTEEDDMTS